MRLCLVTREYPPVTEYSGGIGTAFAHLAPALVGQGHEVHVITITRSGGWHEVRDGVHLHVVRRPTPERLWFLEEAGWTIAVDRAIRRLGRFDVVFAPEWGGEAALFAGRRRTTPVITSLTTSVRQAVEISPGWERSSPMRARHRVQGPLERIQTERSDGILACSNAILDWTRDLWRIDDIPTVVIGNGLPLEQLRANADGPPGPAYPRGEGRVVLFCGRIEIRKGVDVLVRAMRRVWEADPTTRLVLLGRDGEWKGGSMAAHLKELAGPWKDRMHVLGAQPSVAVPPMVSAADVVALPSLWENNSLAALEALALGSAVVATSGSGYDDFIADGENGQLVSPGDEAHLSRALLALLADDDLRARLGATAAARSVRFAVEAVAAEHARFFADIAAR